MLCCFLGRGINVAFNKEEMVVPSKVREKTH